MNLQKDLEICMYFTIFDTIFNFFWNFIQKLIQNLYATYLKNKLKKVFIFIEKSNHKIIFDVIIKNFKLNTFF